MSYCDKTLFFSEKASIHILLKYWHLPYHRDIFYDDFK